MRKPTSRTEAPLTRANLAGILGEVMDVFVSCARTMPYQRLKLNHRQLVSTGAESQLQRTNNGRAAADRQHPAEREPALPGGKEKTENEQR